MTVRNLDALFRPNSVTVIEASDTTGERAFIATDPEEAPDTTRGVVRVVADPDSTEVRLKLPAAR